MVGATSNRNSCVTYGSTSRTEGVKRFFQRAPKVVQIPDAPTQKQLVGEGLAKMPKDQVITLNWWQKTLNGLETAFIRIPQAFCKGITGEKDFNFSDAQTLSKLPFYLGGAILALGFIIGGNRKEIVANVMAVGLYLLTLGATHTGINAVIRWRYGVDLTQRYKSADGRMLMMHDSATFFRSDLVPDNQYRQEARKMGIPWNVNDPKAAVSEQTRRVIIVTKAWKMIMGNLGGAIAAGFIGRAKSWPQVWEEMSAALIPKSFKEVLTTPLRVFKTLAPVMNETLNLRGKSGWQQAAIYSYAALGAAMLYQLLFKTLAPKHYIPQTDQWRSASTQPPVRITTRPALQRAAATAGPRLPSRVMT